jgi:hypothetical protein
MNPRRPRFFVLCRAGIHRWSLSDLGARFQGSGSGPYEHRRFSRKSDIRMTANAIPNGRNSEILTGGYGSEAAGLRPLTSAPRIILSRGRCSNSGRRQRRRRRSFSRRAARDLVSERRLSSDVLRNPSAYLRLRLLSHP